MKRDVVAYPVSAFNTHLIQYNDLLKDINIVGIFSDDLPKSMNLDKTHIVVFDNFIDALLYTDTIFIPPLPKQRSDLQIEISLLGLLSQIDMAIQKKKNIWSLHAFEPEITDALKEKCARNGVEYKELLNQSIRLWEVERNREIWDMNSPLIACGGISPECRQFDTELELRKRFLNNGYKVSQVGSSSCSNVYGAHVVPDFIFDHRLNEEKKTLCFNAYLKEIEAREQPDVFILGFPTAMIPYNNKHPMGFGNIPFIMSHSLVADYTVINLNVGEYDGSYLDDLSLILHYRFNLKPDMYVVSNLLADYSAVDQIDGKYYSCDDEIVDNFVKKIKYGVARFREIDFDDLYTKIVYILANT